MELLKQKISYVPWFNTNEWFGVYELLYGKNADITTKRKALDILNIWKLRTPLLHSGVEGTLIILGGILLSDQSTYETRLIKSTSVMRFLNICAAHDKRQGTFYQTAKKRKIPEWIISLRHEAAHSQHLPMEDILNKALDFCYNWLYNNYWLPVSAHIQDYIPEYKTIQYDELKSVLEPYMTNYLYITLSTHPNWNYEIIGDISDDDVKLSVVNDLEILLTNENIDNDTKLSHILQMLWMKMENILQSRNCKGKGVLPNLMVENEIFFCDIDEYNEIFTDTDPQNITENFLFLWENLLKNIHSCGMISELMDELLKVVNNSSIKHLRRKVAALWLLELGKSFKKCNLANNLYQKLPLKAKIKMTTKKFLFKLRDHCENLHPEYKSILTLSLLTKIPDVFSKIELFKENFLKEPNEYTLIYLPTFLDLCDDFKNIVMKNKVLKLIELYQITNSKNEISSNLYQIDDVKKAIGNNYDELFKNYELNSASVENMETEDDNNDVWKLVTDVEFRKCPVGILPWQSTANNPFINI